ncbi:cation-transporting P-type ATPase [Methyloversatilis sp. XJ19-49]|uniref:cation-transporting P-type ATPase n=1 Tax=Methyloversatilis sp. XJ19-49 TaxID=2963429 RepID=UPI00211C937B|nr:cation-transporting P-type ATPase [Methyloversatilis sp. XJ19-49]MCQ9376875.1 cation-transporting P-type ATPase [Methyloversatilis sp. XJ19-49]
MRQPTDTPARPENWHALTGAATLTSVGGAREAGLTTDEAARRLAADGANSLPVPAGRSVVQRLLAQFENVLIRVLIGAAVVTTLLGHLLDSAIIAGVVLINALIGFLQEGKAEAALDAIRKMLSPRAQVLRGGRRIDLPAAELVRGDIVFLASGDRVPADLRLLDGRNLRIDESALTGESVAVDKHTEVCADDAALGDRRSMAFSGTLVTYGQGTGVVVATGASTQIGHISTLLAGVQELATPLTRRMAAFSAWLTWTILGVAALAFGFGILVRDYSVADMFLAAVGLAVAAIPEGLPAIMTVTLAIGVQRMAKRHAIIRRLPAVEALGSVTVICSDKTGTLTRNEMTVQRVVTARDTFRVSGAGYAPQGGFARGDGECELTDCPELVEIGRTALLCNDAALNPDGEGRWVLAGDPTEGALITLALKSGLDARRESDRLPRIDTIPFESEHRFMATLHHDHQGHAFMLLKGAPERVFELCREQREDGDAKPLHPGYWHACSEAIAGEGMRLIALAVKPMDASVRTLTFADVESGGFTLLALLGLADPPREEAVAAVARCRGAGIAVRMITGDHAVTARAIGEQLGLGDTVRVLSGPQIEQMDDGQLRAAVGGTEIFARASPEHKLRIVQALQANGDVVAMTGDGVNDAPALKRADVGVAMGDKGTEAAKEAAEMVLADDNFASIAAAVEEGRTVFDNIRKSVIFILPTGGGEAGILVAAILLGLTLPITPAQILWVNMVTAVTLSLALAFETPEADIMRRPPRDPDEPLLTRFLLWRIVFVSLLLVTGGLFLFLRILDEGGSLELARTVVVNTLVFGEIVYLFNVRHLTASSLTFEGVTGNRYVLLAILVLLVLQGLFNYLPAAQMLFGTAPPQTNDWWPVLVFGALLMVIIELEKLAVRSWARRGRQSG